MWLVEDEMIEIVSNLNMLVAECYLYTSKNEQKVEMKKGSET